MKRIIAAVAALALVTGAGLAQPNGKLTGPDTPVEASGFESKAHGGWGDFPPALTLDNDLAPQSSWRAENSEDLGAWVQYDLVDTCRVTGVNLGFLKGDKRRYKFHVSVSLEKEKWTTVFHSTSCGTTTALEAFDIPDTVARHVRITGFSNKPNVPDSAYAFGKWINITETEIIGTR